MAEDEGSRRPQEVVSPLSHDLVGGRLQMYLHRWKEFTKNQYILGMVRGVRLELIKDPPIRKPSMMNYSEDHRRVIREELRTLLSKGAIVRDHEEHNMGVFSPIFAIPKKSGGWRVILDLRFLNSYVEKRKFKMEGISTALEMVEKDCYFTKIDVSDAYFHLGIDRSHQKYLRFEFEGQTYRYVAMPFGITCAPRRFTKLIKEVAKVVREEGIRIVHYVRIYLKCNNIIKIYIITKTRKQVLYLYSHRRKFEFSIFNLKTIVLRCQWRKRLKSNPKDYYHFLLIII